MTIFGWILLILLLIIILIQSISLYWIIKNATYLSDKSKEIIIFVIDMYIEYGEEIGITSKDKHDILIKNLKNVKKKLGE